MTPYVDAPSVTLHPDKEWCTNIDALKKLTFPVLRYRVVSKINTPPCRRPAITDPDELKQLGANVTAQEAAEGPIILNLPPFKNEDLLRGGSYAMFHQLPHHEVRCAIFESNLFPYRALEASRFSIRHACMLWPLTLQLQCYTQKSNPARVYITDSFEKEASVIARMTFHPEYIELYELCPSMSAAPESAPVASSSRISLPKPPFLTRYIKTPRL